MPQDDHKMLAFDMYKSIRDRVDTEKLDPVEFSTALINVSKVLLHEEMGAEQGELFFDMVNKSFLIEKNNVTYH